MVLQVQQQLKGGKAHAKAGDHGFGGGQLPSFPVTCIYYPFSTQFLFGEMLLPQWI